MSLGGAIMPVPYGMIIDAGRPELVLVVVAVLLLLSLLCASVGLRRAPVPVAAE
jgi:fucose permease